MLTPWIRSFNYIEDYFRTLYELYSGAYIASYPVTYYSINQKQTVWENDQLLTGSYEKVGVGSLSGVKWNSIHMFPVFAIESATPTTEQGEKGIQYYTNLNIQLSFPSIYGLIPIENDLVDLSFGYKVSSIDLKMLYIITSVQVAHVGDIFQMYRLSIKSAPITKDMLDKQIADRYYFYDYNKKIIPYSNTKRLLNMQLKYSELVEDINYNIFNPETGLYLI